MSVVNDASSKMQTNTQYDANKRYYGECIHAVPFHLMVDFLSQDLPRSIAWMVTASIRAKEWLGLGDLPASCSGPVGSDTRLPREQMPGRPMSRWSARLEVLGDLGFQPLAFAVGDHVGAKESASILLLDDGANNDGANNDGANNDGANNDDANSGEAGSGSVFALLEWFRMPGASGIEEQNLLELNSLITCSGGDSPYAEFTELMTMVTPRKTLALSSVFIPKFVDASVLADSVSVKKAVQQHRKRCKNREIERIERERAIARYDSLSQGRFDWMLGQGLIRELKPTEVEKISLNRLAES